MKNKYIHLSVIVSVIYIIVFFSFSSGIFNGIIEGKNYDQPIFLPSRSIQNLYETTIGISILIGGFIGTFLMYKAKNIGKLNEKYALLGSGLFLIMLSKVFLYKVIDFKS